jgi:hypothetical protein
MLRRLFLCLAVLLAGSAMLIAQKAPAPAVAPVVPKTLSVDDVIKLSKAGLSDDTIIEKIRKSGQAFDLSPDQMIQLKGAGVSDKVMQAMINPTAPPPAVAATTGIASAAKPSDLPDEIGVYMRRQGTTGWVEVQPEVVNWKTGGVAKSIFSQGIVKGDMNGHLEGKSSSTSATTTTEFMIVAADGVAITEYQLLKLRENSDNREFRTMTGGVFHSSGGATRDLVKFDGKKVAPHHYVVQLSENLKPGEYGILPPGAVSSTNAAGSTGKIYSFKVLE